VRRDAVIEDIEEEMRSHVEMETQMNIERGMKPEEARRAALRSFGNPGQMRDLAYDVRGGGMLETLWQDLRYALRVLAKKPGFTLVAVITAALGIGANTAIFSVVNAVLLRPLPFEDPGRLVVLWEVHPKMVLRNERANVSPANFADWRDQNQVFEEVAALDRQLGFNLSDGGTPERIQGARASASLFTLLGVQPMLGRAFLPEEDQDGKSQVILLSHRLWQRRFGSDPDIVGKTLKLNLRGFTVVGVMPREFTFPEDVEFWVPMASDADELKTRDFHYLNVIARLKPGVTMDRAQTEMSVIARRLEQQYPESNAQRGVQLDSLQKYLVGDVKPALLVLLGAVGFVLLIACANIANLLLARAASRQKEIAIRTALGATRLRVVQQLLTESVLLALMGGTLGLVLALWGVDLLVRLSPGDLPGLGKVGVDGRVLGFTLAVSLLTGLVFGLLPALQATRLSLNETLKEGGRSSSEGAGPRRTRNLLVVAEVSLSLILLVGAGLMIKSFLRLSEVNPGFRPDHLLTLRMSPTISKFHDQDEGVAFYQQVIQRMAELPGVESVGAITHPPLSHLNLRLAFAIEGRPPAAPGEEPSVEARAISPDYFQTMDIPLIKGRDFTPHDNRKSAPVVIINEAMARRYWQDEDPIGKRLSLEGLGAPLALEIVGVVGNVKHWGLDQDVRDELYWPLFQRPLVFMTLMIRTKTDPAVLADAVRREAAAIDKDQPVYMVKTMDQWVSESVAQRRLNMLLLAVFAAVAIILAAVGIYGVMSYSVTQHTREIGIRVALGARAGDVLRQIVGQGMMLATAGVAIGVAAAYMMAKLLSGFSGLLYGVTATDPTTFAGIALLLLVVALVACWMPARRATKVDPMVALRYE
jgi:putative ABC transport system permease protein